MKTYRHKLNQEIDPILEKFYLQLKSEPSFTLNLPPLNIGYTRNVQLKSEFPDYRNMNLTKNVKGKNAKKHIGEPSFIISMGKSRVEGKFLEVRVGVEENYLSELSDNGSIFLRNLILKKKDVIAKLQSLSADWSLSHGVYTINKMTTISANKINENSLVDICNYYLQTREAADLCIRKFYYVEQDKCAKEIFNPLVTRTISKDFETLKFFFDLSF